MWRLLHKILRWGSSGFLSGSAGFLSGSAGFLSGSAGFLSGSAGFLSGSAGFLSGSAGFLSGSAGFFLSGSSCPGRSPEARSPDTIPAAPARSAPLALKNDRLGTRRSVTISASVRVRSGSRSGASIFSSPMGAPSLSRLPSARTVSNCHCAGRLVLPLSAF